MRGQSPVRRVELEITDITRPYLEAGSLDIERMGASYAWLDTGTHASLLEASTSIQIVEDRQGLKICCPCGDERVFFVESWNTVAFVEHGHPGAFVQDNPRRSARGALRGCTSSWRVRKGNWCGSARTYLRRSGRSAPILRD